MNDGTTKDLKDGILGVMFQGWVVEGIIEMLPKDESVTALSHYLTIRTKEHPEGYSIDIMGVKDWDERIEMTKNDHKVEPEDRAVKMKFKDQVKGDYMNLEAE